MMNTVSRANGRYKAEKCFDHEEEKKISIYFKGDMGGHFVKNVLHFLDDGERLFVRSRKVDLYARLEDIYFYTIE